MEISIVQEQAPVPVTVFRLKGDLTTEEELHARTQEAFDQGARNMLLDLKEVPFMSSSGLRAIYAIYIMLRERTAAESDEVVRAGIASGAYTSPHLKLLNPSDHVLEVLKTAGYDMFLTIHHDYQSALNSYSTPGS
jgi:hypothetical protein